MPRLLAEIMLATLTACAGEQHRSAPAGELPLPPEAAASTTGSPQAPPPACQPDATTEPDASAMETHFVYGPFFTRLGRQAAQTWNGPAILQRLAPQRRRPGARPTVTVVMICLTRAGELAGVSVKSSSGFPEIDAETVRAIAAGAPFTNPPDGLVGADGVIRFSYRMQAGPTTPANSPSDVVRLNPQHETH